ncbi:hypothetical protein AGMMS49975_28710 [Clostridia bacterium]|nr:hypothetical protein AGMMS49975_28710 [Clostridia bacterium]
MEDLEKVAALWGYPVVIKTTTGGYDGKGNYLLKDADDLENAFGHFGSNQIMAERFIKFKAETSVLACRRENGQIVVYPSGENVHEDGILRQTLVPADISETAETRSRRISEKIMKIFDGIGMFCVELFVDYADNIYVNEIAPRPHNSGHYTIEGCVVSQFAQHIRAVAGLPLGDTSLRSPAVMMNVLGEGKTGKASVSGVDDALAIDGVFVHIYGKENSVNKRKMGHITAIAGSLPQARRNCEDAAKSIRIVGV